MEIAVVETLTALPASCKICGGADKEWYLDTGTQEEYYGAVVYCNECVAHIAEVCGFLPPQRLKLLEREIDDLRNENYELKTRLDGYRSIQDGLNTLASGSVSPVVGSDSSSVPQAVESGAGSIPATGETVGIEGGTAPESSDDVDVAGVHSDSEQPGEFRLTID